MSLNLRRWYWARRLTGLIGTALHVALALMTLTPTWLDTHELQGARVPRSTDWTSAILSADEALSGNGA